MPGRSVLQWDKNDIEDMGLLKIDLLGLGMMAALQDAVEICAQRGQPVDLARLPKDDPAVFRLMQEADTIGVFQVESRAQMSTLPRMKPQNFYDLAVEVAIIRPGPIHGDAVNPYLRRRAGEEPVTYPDERARPILERTLGVVLFQEQILRLAMELGGFTAAEADELRRAIGFTRSQERLDRMKERLTVAFRKNGVSEPAVEYLIQVARLVRALRVSRVARDQLRADRVLERLAEGAPARRVLRFAPQLPADGVLFAGEPRPGRPAPRRHVPAGLRPVLRREVPRGLGHHRPAGAGDACTACAGRRSQSMLAARGERPFASLADFLGRTRVSARPSAGCWPAPGRSTPSRTTGGPRSGASRPSTPATSSSPSRRSRARRRSRPSSG